MAYSSSYSPSDSIAQRPAARWECRPSDPEQVRCLCRDLRLPPLVARILSGRGLYDPEQVETFVQPMLRTLHDPFSMDGIEPAVQRVGEALASAESIRIYGDYDVDGVTATTILMDTLGELGCSGDKLDYYIPHRVREGYGLNLEAIEQLAGEGVGLVITVDCGVTAVEEARRLKQLGVDLIVTDHHEPGSERPEACAIINPKLDGCGYPFADLAGAGVAFKLAHALLKRLHPDPDRALEFLKSLLDLVALGTVADIVPLTGENRVLVAHGLERLRASERTGLRALIKRAGLRPEQIDAESISFGIAPRINAAGRTDHAMFGMQLLMTEDPDEAASLAGRLEDFNVQRRDIELDLFDEALELLEPFLNDRVLVVAQDGWHAGVIGIVASRIIGRYYRPTIVITVDGDRAKGSGRSIPGFDLNKALGCCDEHLLQYGGHKMAAGLSLEMDRIEDFRAAINAHAADVLGDEMLRPLVEIDAVAEPEDLTHETVEALEMLAPFGNGNPKPVIAVEDYQLIDSPRVLKERHLKLRLAGPMGEPLTALGWGMADRLREVPMAGGRLRLAGALINNTWNGRTEVEMILKDFQAV